MGVMKPVIIMNVQCLKMCTEWSLCLEFRKRNKFFPWNTNSSKNWNTSYAGTPQFLVIFALRSSLPIWSSLIALENWFWVFSVSAFWYIIRLAPLLVWFIWCRNLIIPKIRCYLNGNAPLVTVILLEKSSIYASYTGGKVESIIVNGTGFPMPFSLH